MELDRIYRVRAGQTLYVSNSEGQVTAKRLNRAADAALYQREDTLYAAFVPQTLPPADADPHTLDQADSALVMFVSYNLKQQNAEEISPWFYYQMTSFDIDLFTTPFKYRFSTAGMPGSLSTSANIGVYTGIRYDLGRYRNLYFRGQQRSDMESFSFGMGTIASISSVPINEYTTSGLVPYEYDALGLNYGLAGIVGYKNVTTGLALGFENLADRNNKHWIYRQKPWLGIFVGININ
ncbi:hypothetical protein [Telluribacter sp. SYSU D00476]|uniref:hypothetical protein n=1 Tax=Telluribacter sp. SYSU D00476 TaxID=2811430 RepID=UPI001FF1D5AB|nr:hypothetical protein [Telluribacter sp. SYSU D00476]